MSQAKIHIIKKAQKPQGKCQVCGVEINPGDPYRFFVKGFRSKFKNVRCMKVECTPTRGQRESSMLADIYDAQDAFNADDIMTVDDATSALEEVASVARELGEQYREAGTNPNTGIEFNMDNIERAETLENAADELESWSFEGDDEPEACEVHKEDEENDVNRAMPDEDGDCPDCQDIYDQWLEELREAVRSAVDEMELP